MSPSEDERAAEAVLRDHAPPHGHPRVTGDLVRNFMHSTIQLTSGIQEEGAPRNVLAQRHKNNQHATTALRQAAKKHSQDDEDDPQEHDDEDQDQARVAPPPVIVDLVREFCAQHNTANIWYIGRGSPTQCPSTTPQKESL